MTIPPIDNSLVEVYGSEGVELVNNLKCLVADKSWTLVYIRDEGFVAIFGCGKEVSLQEIQDIFAHKRPGRYEPVIDRSLYYGSRKFRLVQSKNLASAEPLTQSAITRMMGRMPPLFP